MSSRSAPPPSRPPLAGQLGRYWVMRRIAVGGMAEIYLALAEASGPDDDARLVVLKRLRPELARHPRFVRMFLDEARVAALLRHPNIARVFEVGEIDGEDVIAMEYVAGRNVAALIAGAHRAGASCLPAGPALAIASDVAAGLHHAHERCGESGEPLGIVHRDVSPSNVQVDRGGRVKLLDFGVAKSALPRDATRAGVIKGKRRYMSPEQVQAKPVDRRSDLFSLGVLTYEMLAGTPPFDGRSDGALVRRLIRDEPVPLARLRPDLPPELGALVARLMAKRPDERPATAEAVRLELDAIAQRADLVTPPAALAAHVRGLFGEPDPDVEVPAEEGAPAPASETPQAFVTAMPSPRPVAAPLAGRRRGTMAGGSMLISISIFILIAIVVGALALR